MRRREVLLTPFDAWNQRKNARQKLMLQESEAFGR
jgi:hypothetical protein